MSKTLMISLFIVAVLIGFYVDYQKDKKVYGSNGRRVLYLVAMGLVALAAVYYIITLIKSFIN